MYVLAVLVVVLTAFRWDATGTGDTSTRWCTVIVTVTSGSRTVGEVTVAQELRDERGMGREAASPALQRYTV